MTDGNENGAYDLARLFVAAVIVDCALFAVILRVKALPHAGAMVGSWAVFFLPFAMCVLPGGRALARRQWGFGVILTLVGCVLGVLIIWIVGLIGAIVAGTGRS